MRVLARKAAMSCPAGSDGSFTVVESRVATVALWAAALGSFMVAPGRKVIGWEEFFRTEYL